MSSKTGRNEPCPCGSGRKYKSCCEGREGRRADRVTSWVTLGLIGLSLALVGGFLYSFVGS